MAGYDREAVLVGAAAIFVTTQPLDEASTPAALPEGLDAAASPKAMAALFEGAADWRGVGYTTGGVEVTYTPDFGEVEVDQELDAVVMFKQRMTVTVGTTLAQAELDNLTFAWGQRDDTITGATGTRTLTIESGELGDRPVERGLIFIGQAPGRNSKGRVYKLNRALNVESSAHSLSRADATAIPVSLRCLPEAGEYGTITDYFTTTP